MNSSPINVKAYQALFLKISFIVISRKRSLKNPIALRLNINVDCLIPKFVYEPNSYIKNRLFK